ncbi:hypothetical protein [Acinetobacter thermotolerans]|uniref:hypothetical protein n=1 Tax=Acinetobacter thermotolerans TaxID=3151487 RepID=UPI00325BAFE3
MKYFKPSVLTVALASIAACAHEYYAPERPKTWQDVEDGPVAEEFARFVQGWNADTKFTVQIETAPDMEIYSMTADDVPFTFKRIENRYSLSYGGDVETIQASTFEYFAEGALQLNAVLNMPAE